MSAYNIDSVSDALRFVKDVMAIMPNTPFYRKFDMTNPKDQWSILVWAEISAKLISENQFNRFARCLGLMPTLL